MLASIEAVAHSASRGLLGGASSIRLAAEAATGALARAELSYDAIDAFINVGVYRDQNICEPAVASMIQRAMGHASARRPVFSFDLANGACGLLNALEVVDSLVRAGGVRRALVVAADVDPAPRDTIGFDIEPAGVGMVIGAHDGEGFTAFHAETFGACARFYESHLEWQGATSLVQSLLGTGTHRLEIEKSEDFCEQASLCAFASASRFLASQDLSFADLDLVIATGAPHGLSSRLAELARIAPDRVVSAEGRLAEAHTAGTGLSIEAAIDRGLFGKAKRTLLIAAGSGISVASALYQR